MSATTQAVLPAWGPIRSPGSGRQRRGLIRFEFLAPEGVISLPLAELERAIAGAKVEVHSEGLYDEPTDDS